MDIPTSPEPWSSPRFDPRTAMADTLPDVIATLDPGQLPPEIVHQAKRCLLDLVGVAAAGRRTEAAAIALTFAARHLGPAAQGGTAAPRLLFDGRRSSAAGAAFAGATVIDSFDAHDGHALTKGHAGVAVLPALLAFADGGSPMDGPAFLTSLVLGYEIAIRAGIALHASACDYHTSGAWNALGCAAVVARLLRLPPAQTREALGIAEYNGPRSQMMRCIAHPTMVKDGSGWGALAGVSAALLAQDGFTGAPAILAEDASQHAFWSDLGRRWRIMELYFKPYPVCRWAQPAMEAARTLLAAHPIDPARIASVTVETFAEAAALATAVPCSTDAAQYSLPFPLAALILRGAVDAAAISGPGLTDPDVLRLAARVRMVADPAIAERFPAERLAVVTIALEDGTEFRSAPTTARGDPADPLPDAEIAAKFHRLASALSPERRARIEREVAGLDRCADVSPLLDLILEAA